VFVTLVERRYTFASYLSFNPSIVRQSYVLGVAVQSVAAAVWIQRRSAHVLCACLSPLLHFVFCARLQRDFLPLPTGDPTTCRTAGRDGEYVVMDIM
jgi:hypothetical protein